MTPRISLPTLRYGRQPARGARGAYTVDIGAPNRHDGEAPWTYIVTATDADDAAHRALGAIRADQEPPGFDPATSNLGAPTYVALTVTPGLPAPTDGRAGNDRRRAACASSLRRMARWTFRLATPGSHPVKRTTVPKPVSGVADAVPEPRTVEMIIAECVGYYYTDARDAYAFLFRIPDGGQRFTVYATTPGRYTIGDRYRMTLTPAVGQEGRS